MADAFHISLESTQEAKCPHRNPNHTIEGSFATSKKLFYFFPLKWLRGKRRCQEHLIVPNDSMRLENVGQPPSVASHPLPDREQLPWKASQGLLWSEAHWTPLPVSSPAVPAGHTQLPAVHQLTLLPVQPLRTFASSLLCWEYLPSLPQLSQALTSSLQRAVPAPAWGGLFLYVLIASLLLSAGTFTVLWLYVHLRSLMAWEVLAGRDYTSLHLSGSNTLYTVPGTAEAQ